MSAGSETEASTGALVDRVLSESADPDAAGEAATRRQITTLIEQVVEEGVRATGDVESMIAARIAEIDTLLSAQVNTIIHAPEFQRLEASWRGLHHLVAEREPSRQLKIRVLDVAKDDLRRDLESASEFDQSALFKKVYEEEYGTFGGEPFGALVADYEFGRHPQDVALLERFANVAAAAHAPVITGASPALFGWDGFAQLAVARDVAKIFTTPEYVKWRAFRDSEDSRYVGLTLPRVLLREPYGPETDPVGSFCFREEVNGRDASRYLWGNAAYALGARLAAAFERYHWCASLRGVDGGGLVEGFPSPAFGTDGGGLAVRGPTEVAVTDPREKELADLGFIALVHCKGTDCAVFYSTQSCQKAKRYDTDEANANARLATQLQYILGTSRFAHYLKVMVRDKLGTMGAAGEYESFLNQWLSSYCLGNPEAADLETRARRPLRSGHVTVREVRGKPGAYEAVVHLQPHFQLDELSVELRLVTELPVPQGG